MSRNRGRRMPGTNLFPERVKWYAGAIRLLARPTARQLRALEKAVGDWGAAVGVDGALLHVGKWPDDFHEGPAFVRGLERLGLPLMYRIAPLGRDCEGGCWSERPCKLGDCAACEPDWNESDWRTIGA